MKTKMQKLGERDTYTPVDIPHVRGNCGLSLNREDTLGVAGLKTHHNSSDAALTAIGHAGQDLRVPAVYVLNMRGEPLMPCSPQKARCLLKESAEVVRRTPFTIRLKSATGEARQVVKLGVDSGFVSVGLSAVTENREVYSAEVDLRKDIVKLNLERTSYRRTRRGRKTWHRKPRFLNRKKPVGWLAPSIQHKVDSHIKLIGIVQSILPISKTVIEVATFDSQKMQNPEISGVEYQQGELQGYMVREYLLEKFGRRCAYCKKQNIPLEIEHIVPKSRGGSNRVSNLTISCESCNKDKDNKTAEEYGHPKIRAQAEKTLKSLPFMNLVRTRIAKDLGCGITFGYKTKHDRIKLGIEKSHINDAFVIAGGGTHERNTGFSIQQVRKCNRKLFRGSRSHIRNTGPRVMRGFQRFDKVIWGGEECFVFGRRAKGGFALRKLNGVKVHTDARVRDIRLIESSKTILTEVKSADSSPP